MIKKLLVSTLLALLPLISFATPALAIVAPDSTPTIDAVNVYEDCLEENDQLYVIEYTISYAAPPSDPIDDTFMFRLMNGSTELGTTTAYAYNNDGYGSGIAAIYFSAQDITDKSMAWEGAYTVVLAGDPLLIWTGTYPYITSTTYEAWNDPIGTELGDDIITLAQELSATWGLAAASDLYQPSGGTTYLSSEGEDYFATSIPNLVTMQPDIFSASITAARFPDRDHSLDEAIALAPGTYWASTPFDLSNTATALNIDLTFVYGLAWAAVIMIILYLVSKNGMTINLEFILLIGGVMTTFGAVLRFVPMLVPVMIGVVLTLIFAYKMFYNPSGA